MYGSLKYLGLALVMLLGLYPIAELTRVILVSGMFYFPEMQGQLYAEVAVMWILYLSIVPVFLMFNGRNLSGARRTSKPESAPGAQNLSPDTLPNNKDQYIPVKYIR